MFIVYYARLRILLFLCVSVSVLPSNDVVSEECGHQVNVQEVFVQVLPEGPGGNLVHRVLSRGWLPEYWGYSRSYHSTAGLPVYNKVSPQVAHNPCYLPVIIVKVKHSGGEEVEELVPVCDSPGDGGLSGGEQEVPERVSSVVFKGVEIVNSSSQGVELHELIGRGFDEEGSYQLNREVLNRCQRPQILTLIIPSIMRSQVPSTSSAKNL